VLAIKQEYLVKPELLFQARLTEMDEITTELLVGTTESNKPSLWLM